MAIKTANIQITGVSPLIIKNPQTVDRFNKFSRRMSEINAKKTRRTDEDYLELADLEVQSALYWDDELGVYIPARWIMAAICKVSNKVAKIPKADIRASVFPIQDKTSLKYKNSAQVKSPDDIVGNDFFRHKMILPQGQVRIAKTMPIFHEWEFSFDLEFDASLMDKQDLTRIIEFAAIRGGFGDFRPTFGRGTAVITHG
jgi:hypothetical protein